MVLKLELCALHKTGIFAVTDQTSPDPQTQGDRPRPALSPTPPNASPPVNPNADRVLSRGTDGAASHPAQRTPRRSRSPVRRPHAASPSRALAPFSRTSLPESCLAVYNEVKTKVQDRRFPRTIKEALSSLKISERTWRRKQKIAELMILDRSRFDEIAARLMRDGGAARLNQTTLVVYKNSKQTNPTAHLPIQLPPTIQLIPLYKLSPTSQCWRREARVNLINCSQSPEERSRTF